MPFGKRWFGPRTWITESGYGQHGDCSCCGCSCQSAVGDVDDSSLEAESRYTPYFGGVRAKIVIGGLPALVEWSLAQPVQTVGSEKTQQVTNFSMTGLDGINGTYLVNLPVSQYGCLWGNSDLSEDYVYQETFPIEIVAEQTQRRTYDNCSTYDEYTETGTQYVTATLQVDIVRKNESQSPNVANSTIFRYVSVRLFFSHCQAVASDNTWVIIPVQYRTYWPLFANDQYRLDRPFWESLQSAFYGSGVGFDCKRLGNQASGSFAWAQTNCTGVAANDQATAASLCGMTGGADVAEVSGTVGSYTVEIERL